VKTYGFKTIYNGLIMSKEEDNRQGKSSCLCFRTNSTLLDAFFDSTDCKLHFDSTADGNVSKSSMLYDAIVHPGIRDLEEKLLKKEKKKDDKM